MEWIQKYQRSLLHWLNYLLCHYWLSLFFFTNSPFIGSQFHTHNIIQIFHHDISLSCSNFKKMVSRFDSWVCGRFFISWYILFWLFFEEQTTFLHIIMLEWSDVKLGVTGAPCYFIPLWTPSWVVLIYYQ